MALTKCERFLFKSKSSIFLTRDIRFFTRSFITGCDFCTELVWFPYLGPVSKAPLHFVPKDALVESLINCLTSGRLSEEVHLIRLIHHLLLILVRLQVFVHRLRIIVIRIDGSLHA